MTKVKKVSFAWILTLIIIALIILPCSYAWSLELEYFYKRYILQIDYVQHSVPILLRLAYAILLTAIGISVIYVLWRCTNLFHVYDGQV